MPRFVSGYVLERCAEHLVLGSLADLTEDELRSDFREEEAREYELQRVLVPGCLESRPVASTILIQRQYVSVRLLFQLGLWLETVGEVGAQTRAGPSAYFVVSALVECDSRKELLGRVLVVVSGCLNRS